MKTQNFIALLVLSLATVSGARAAVLAGPLTNAASGHVYYLLSANTWTASEAEARELAGHLVTINDAAENQWVLNTFSPLTGVAEARLWIGLNDAANEGQFVWASGEPVTFTYWYPGEPDNGGPGGEDHVALFHSIFVPPDGRWLDISDLVVNPHILKFGVVEVFLAPVTQPADQFMPGSARLNGQVNPIGSPTLAWFEWGTSLAYGNTTPPQSVGSGLIDVRFSNALAGLVSGTDYYFRSVASNAFGLAAGVGQTFNLNIQRPVVTTLAADQLLPASARLKGQVNPQGWATAAWFEWGTDTNYGNATPPQSVGTGGNDVAFSTVLAGLVSGTEYRFRAVASNAFGFRAGQDQTFDLNTQRPVVTTLAADQLANTNAQLRGQVNPQGWPTVAWFEWGTSSAYGNATPPESIGSGGIIVGFSNMVAGLLNGTDYHFRALASNAFGFRAGQDQTFILNNQRPVVTTLPADQLTTTNARLRGQVTPRGWPTTAWFEWGTDTNYGNLIGMQDVGHGSSVSDFNVVLDGLRGGPTYHYRLVATNASGGVYGVDQTFNLGFVSIPIPGLPGVFAGSVAWGDYDNDGRLDFLLTGHGGSPISQVWRNTGNGFSNVTASVAPGLPGVYQGSAAWGDYDNDGRLDFLLTGSGICQLWRNTGSGFSNMTASVAPGLPGGVLGISAAWGDYDNDGRLDFLLTGGGPDVSTLWRNTGSGFSNVTASVAPGVPAASYGSVAWGDYDNDRRLDFLLTGSFRSQLWRNTGAGFSNVTASVAPGLAAGFNGTVAWGDYDNDGRLDFLLTSTYYGSQVWRNTASGFSNVTASIAPGLPARSSVAWGDYDNDGRLDFLISGTSNAVPPQLWRNTGGGFSNVTASVASGLPSGGSVAWGDYDNDGRLDFLHAAAGQLRRNNMSVDSNAPPAAPTGLSSALSGATVSLSWNPPADDRTPSAGLNYNLRIGTTPGASDVLAPMALTDGLRLLPVLGNAQTGTNALMTLPFGRYYWSVQAVDTSFAGSPFAAEQQFTLAPRLFEPLWLGNGHFQFSFTNQSSAIYEVLGTTNVSLPVAQWSVLGQPTHLGGGLYQFTDVLAPNHAQRFYLLRQQ